MRIAFTIPVRTVSESNESGIHWGTKARRTKEQRGLALVYARAAVGRRELECPIRITLTRLAPDLLDTGNEAPALKHVQDGIADHLGIDDGDKRLVWRYAQEIAASYAVKVEISDAGEGETK